MSRLTALVGLCFALLNTTPAFAQGDLQYPYECNVSYELSAGWQLRAEVEVSFFGGVQNADTFYGTGSVSGSLAGEAPAKVQGYASTCVARIYAFGSFYNEEGDLLWDWFQIDEIGSGGFFVGAGPNTVTILIDAFIPAEWEHSPNSNYDLWVVMEGDGRGYQYYGATARIASAIDIYNPAVNDTDVASGPFHYAGMSIEYGGDDSVQGASIKQEAKDDWTPDLPFKIQWGYSNMSNVYCDPPERRGQVLGWWTSSMKVHCDASAQYPFYFLAPRIDWDIDLWFTFYDNGFDYTFITGCHDGFPSYEVYFNGSRAHDNWTNGNPLSLAGSCDVNFGGKTGSIR